MVGSRVGRAAETFGVFGVALLVASVAAVAAAVLLTEDGLARIAGRELTLLQGGAVVAAAFFAWRFGWNARPWNPAPVDKLGRDELESLLRRLRKRVPCGHEDVEGVCTSHDCAAYVVDRAFVTESSRRSDGSLESRLRAVRDQAGVRGSPVESAGK